MLFLQNKRDGFCTEIKVDLQKFLGKIFKSLYNLEPFLNTFKCPFEKAMRLNTTLCKVDCHSTVS